MRLRSLVGLAALVFLVLAYIETDGHAQPGGGGFDFKNPDSMFSRYVDSQKSKDNTIEIDKVQSRMDPEMPAKMKAYAAKQGNTTGKMTKEQFADFWTKEALPQMEARQKERAEKGGGGFGGFGQKDGGGTGGFGQKDGGGKGGFGGFGQKDAPATPGGPMGPGGFGKDGGGKDGGKVEFGKGGFGGPGGFGKDSGEKTSGMGEKDKGGKGPGGPGGPGAPGAFEARPFNEEDARNGFKETDRDSNGSLSAQEYDRSDIRREVEKYDVNKNMTIEIDEYVAWRKDRHNAREEERKAWAEFQASRNPMNPGNTPPPVPTSPVPIEGDKPTLNRVGALPKDMPAWFKELDEGKDGDKDGQVGLYEWRAAQKDNAEFAKYDRNEDGLITPEEVLWYDKNADRLAGITPTGPAAPTTKTAEKDKGKTGLFGGLFGKGRDSTKDAAKKDAPAKDAPAKDAPAKDAPAKDSFRKDAATKDAPQKGRRP